MNFHNTALSKTTMSTGTTEQIITHPKSVIVNHSEYYLPGGDLSIQANDTLFWVHKYFFIRESTIWRNVIGMTRRGRTATDPVKLGTHILCSTIPTPDSFAHFLWVFYNPVYSKYITTKGIWTQMYTYALNWGFNEIQGLCWREIIQLDNQEAATFYDWIYQTPSINPDKEDFWVIPEDIRRFNQNWIWKLRV